MSYLAISQYYRDLEQIIQYGGRRNEQQIRFAFQRLLNEYCQAKDFLLVPELPYKDKRIIPDGTVKDALRLDWGYWEAKDEDDDLDKEIEKKLAKGYPDDNILFEDSQTAILLRQGEVCWRISMRDEQALDQLLTEFINYERPEVKDFRSAIAVFNEDLPRILIRLREMINEQSENNASFITARDKFLRICQQSINPGVNVDDVREMIIQHILTEDIFTNIFNDSQFHRDNNIARELGNVINTFFVGKVRRNILGSIEHYYGVIRRTAANIYNHQEKQKFLKAIYENFYKAYNPKAADRLGIVYTPSEIVKFMIESVDYLLDKHFDKLLQDKNVEILDPATGTGTFVTELIEYINKDKLKYKYQHEIHCNEVAILPYYIANLNIEFTYKQKMGEYEEFHNICFVDTLDHTSYLGKQGDLFALSVENTERIKRQNDRKISVIIGNPPYNANQQNENDNNKNRAYPSIDKRVKDTYIAASTAQKTKLYDMYSRFYRWASDRIAENGIIAFVTNSSFINSRTFDGFRKMVASEFSEIYIIDLGGNIREDRTGNVFGITLGVAIAFFVKSSNKTNSCKINYASLIGYEKIDEKLKFLSNHGHNKFSEIKFDNIIPDKQSNWINLNKTDFDTLISVADKFTKQTKKVDEEKSIFKVFLLGVVTNRDEWVLDYSEKYLTLKINYLLDVYNKQKEKNIERELLDEELSSKIKWTRQLKKDLRNNQEILFEENKILKSLYRAFSTKYIYYDKHLNEMQYQLPQLFPNINKHNKVIIYSCGQRASFALLATDKIFSLDIFLPNATQSLPLYRYDKEGNRLENITNWGLTQFQTYYQDKTITKENIFHYVYAVLHNPAYRQKYEQNLKRDFPRIPFYDDFFQWVEWGQKLMDLHINLYRVNSPLLAAKKLKLQ